MKWTNKIRHVKKNGKGIYCNLQDVLTIKIHAKSLLGIFNQVKEIKSGWTIHPLFLHMSPFPCGLPNACLGSPYGLKCGKCKSNEFQAGKFLSEGVYSVLYFFELRFGNISVPFLILPHKRIVNAEITRKRTHVNHVVIFK